MNMCPMEPRDDGSWWCPVCERPWRRKAQRRCTSLATSPEPITPEDIAERTFVCGICPTRRNIDGHCARKACDGQSRKIPIEKLCREARGCPEYHW